MHEWYKRIRTLCPKQHFRRIQMFDAHGAPMSQEQELDRLISYFQTLFTDVHDPLPHPPAIYDLPFTEAGVLRELEHLPPRHWLLTDSQHWFGVISPPNCLRLCSIALVKHECPSMHSTHTLVDWMVIPSSQTE